MAIKVGMIEKGVPVRISDNSPNEHIAIWGISGSGKSTRIEQIVRDIHSSGDTVIIFDLAGQDFRNIVDANRINANIEGVNLKMFDLHKVENGEESYVNFISYLVDTFASVFKLGVRQQGVLRTAIEYGIQNCSKYESEMSAIAAGLDEQESNIAAGVHNRIWQLLHGGIFRENNAKFIIGAINILDFSGINPTAQRDLTEILLSFIWKKIRTENRNGRKIYFVIDECQHYIAKRNSILLEMLRESRKYGVGIIMSTQSNSGFTPTVMAAINQTAVQLFFRPSTSDMKKIAEIVAPQDTGLWLLKLKRLNVGESIAIGNLSVNGKEVQHPLIIYSSYGKQNNEQGKIECLLK